MTFGEPEVRFSSVGRDVEACLSYAEAMVTGEEVSPKPSKGARSDAPLV